MLIKFSVFCTVQIIIILSRATVHLMDHITNRTNPKEQQLWLKRQIWLAVLRRRCKEIYRILSTLILLRLFFNEQPWISSARVLRRETKRRKEKWRNGEKSRRDKYGWINDSRLNGTYVYTYFVITHLIRLQSYIRVNK